MLPTSLTLSVLPHCTSQAGNQGCVPSNLPQTRATDLFGTTVHLAPAVSKEVSPSVPGRLVSRGEWACFLGRKSHQEYSPECSLGLFSSSCSMASDLSLVHSKCNNPRLHPRTALPQPVRAQLPFRKVTLYLPPEVPQDWRWIKSILERPSWHIPKVPCTLPSSAGLSPQAGWKRSW